MLADREPVFETNLKKVKPAKGETQAEVEEYFREVRPPQSLPATGHR
jgi:hypothetical protein